MFRLICMVVLLPPAAITVRADDTDEKIKKLQTQKAATDAEFQKWLESQRRETDVLQADLIKLQTESKKNEKPDSDADAMRAKIALTLAKCAREREAIKAFITPSGCFTDREIAEKYAASQGKPLIVWAGMECESFPSIRKALSGAVHCHIKSGTSDTRPHLMYPARDGSKYWYVTRDKLEACPDCWAKTIADEIATPAKTPAKP